MGIQFFIGIGSKRTVYTKNCAYINKKLSLVNLQHTKTSKTKSEITIHPNK